MFTDLSQILTSFQSTWKKRCTYCWCGQCSKLQPVGHKLPPTQEAVHLQHSLQTSAVWWSWNHVKQQGKHIMASHQFNSTKTCCDMWLNRPISFNTSLRNNRNLIVHSHVSREHTTLISQINKQEKRIYTTHNNFSQLRETNTAKLST